MNRDGGFGLPFLLALLVRVWPIAAYKEPRISGGLCYWEWQVLASSRKFSQLFY